MDSIFKGLRIIDITKVFSGPFATRLLADYGAEVLKIENEKNFDDSRGYPPLKNGWSGYYEILNRNKKGIHINLSDNTDRQKLYSLCKDADVFVENLTPSTKHKLKVDYATLKAINPRLIYASLSGLGQQSDRKYYDVIAQAQSGLMSLSGTPEQPLKIGPSVVDAFSGMTLAFAIASALFSRERTGLGQSIEVSMLACAMNLLENNLVEYSITKKNPTRVGNQDTAISPFGVYKAKDGYIALAAGSNTLWQNLLIFLNKHTPVDSSLFSSNQKRLSHLDELTTLIEHVFSLYSVDALEKMLTDLTIPCSRVNEMSDVYSDKHNYATGALLSFHHSKLGTCVIPGSAIHFSGHPKIGIKPAPTIGQHNNEYDI
ncbi:MAG: hypothetical protein RI947_1347 [Candidatus Parcubacteria bacterium]|jgi:CoA:oxalate CoA-transferase